MIIGIDIGGTSTKLGLVDQGKVVAWSTLKLPQGLANTDLQRWADPAPDQTISDQKISCNVPFGRP
ncbi:MAG: hypothetical protein JST38_05805 [Bacteroidetes bacterium]|nr:hypothetical protein [Bacteroidota bacterium]